MKEQIAIQRLLSQKLVEARLKNPGYSLRAFSGRLGLSSSALSEILNGKRAISRKLAERIVSRLPLDPKEAAELLALFPAKGAASKDSPSANGLPNGIIRRSLQLSSDEFRAISDWYHFAILALLETEDARPDSEWIAMRLRITAREAGQAISRLQRLKLLETQGGKLAPSGKAITTTDHVANLALRKTHAQNLELARNSLETDELDLRDFTAITMAIDPGNLPKAKLLIRDFRERLSVFLEKGNKKEVYKLCVQLIPLSKRTQA